MEGFEGAVVFDIETDNLLPDVSVVHCISVYSVDIKASYRYEGATVEYGVQFLESAKCVIGHNIRGYDLEVLKKLHKYKPRKDQRVVDTMLMGYIGWPERHQQNLESWGHTVGSKGEKLANEDWSVYTPLIGKRCDEDVLMNWDIFKWMQPKFVNWDALELEQDVMLVQGAQEKHGVWVDSKHAVRCIKYLDKEMLRLDKEIRKYAPKDVSGGKFATVKSPFLKGSKVYNKRTKDWFGLSLGTRNPQGAYSKLIIKDFDINSPDKLKTLLVSLGWRPVEYNRVMDKDSGKWRQTSPKITENSFATIPAGLGEDIARYNTLKHRRSLLSNKKDPKNKGLLAHVIKRGDGRVPARAIICGTPTSRYRHMGPVCNIPRPSSVYGGEVRECYSVYDGHQMVGADLSGIEARMIGHYCYPLLGGEALAEEILHGDWHSENATAWGVSRNTAKSILYALLYGAGGPKLARIAGYPDSEGENMKRSFYARWTAIEKLISGLERAYKSRKVLKGIAGRTIYVREKRTLLNSLMQHSSAEVFKMWMVECARLALKFEVSVWQVIAYHDELQYELYSKEAYLAEGWGSLVCKQAELVGLNLGIRVPIAAEYKVGLNWGQTH